jgi:hypothetical protein
MQKIIKIYKPFCFSLLLILVLGGGWYQWERVHSLQNVLRHAYLIEIMDPGAQTAVKSISLPEASIAQISPGYVIFYDTDAGQVTKRNSSLLARLKECRQFHSRPLGSHSNYNVVVYTLLGQHTVLHYEYNISTGELGKGHEWCYVPEDIRVWINNLSIPEREKVQTTDYGVLSVTQRIK